MTNAYVVAHIKYIDRYIFRSMTRSIKVSKMYVWTSFLWSVLHPRGATLTDEPPPPVLKTGEYVTLFCAPP